MTLSQKQQAFTLNISNLIAWGFANGFKLTFGEATRPRSQIVLNYYGYDIIVVAGQVGLKKRLPSSKTLESRHEQRLAVDFNIFKNGILLNDPAIIQPLGLHWISLHPDNVWGGDWDRDGNTLDETFKDPYHFETKP